MACAGCKCSPHPETTIGLYKYSLFVNEFPKYIRCRFKIFLDVNTGDGGDSMSDISSSSLNQISINMIMLQTLSPFKNFFVMAIGVSLPKRSLPRTFCPP